MKFIERKDINAKTEICLKCVGNKIRELRLKNNYTQFDVSCFLDFDKSLVSALERGVYNNITIKTLIKFALLFDVDIEYFIK